MSATIEYLKALRQQQLGKAVDVAELEQRAKAENAAAVKGVRRTKPKRSETKLHLTAHAGQRMAQRGLRVGDVYAIYLHGETEPDTPTSATHGSRRGPACSRSTGAASAGN